MLDSQQHEQRKTPFIIGTVALSILIFAGDLAFHMDVAGGVLYVVVVLVAMWLPERHVYIIAAASTLLIVVGRIDRFMAGMVCVTGAYRTLAFCAVVVNAFG